MRVWRSVLEFVACFVAYTGCLILSLRLLSEPPPSEAARIALSLMPMVPGIAIVWVIVRHLRRLDEMQLRLQFEALGMAFGGTAIITFSYGFLENVGFPKLSMFAVWPLMGFLWFLGGMIGRLRYR